MPVTLTQQLTAVAIIFGIGWIYIAWIKQCLKLRRSNPAGLSYPPGPKGLPLVGSLFAMHNDQEWLTYNNWSRVYGDLVFINVAGVKMLYLNSHQVIHDLLDKQAGIYSDRPDIPMLELLTWDFNFGVIKYGERWRTHSRIFYKYFHARNTPNYYPALVRSSTLLLKELLTESTGLIRSIRTATGAFIMSAVYGHDIFPNSGLSDVYINLARSAMESFEAAANPGSFYVDIFPSLKYVPEWLMPKWAFKRKASLWKPYVMEFKEKPYAMIRELMAAGTAKPCVATKMIQDQLEGLPPERYPKMEDIVKNCIGVAYAGGSDTTVSSISSFFLAMTLNPKVQKRAQEEMDTVLAPGTMPTFRDRLQLPYIEAVAREVVRWHPVSPQAVPHRAMKDNIYRGYFIPQGTLLIGNTWTILHDEKMYPDEPHAFKPERFLNGNGQIDENVFDPSKVAYGAGRRICAGRHIADADIWIIIASVLRVFTIAKKKDQEGKEITPNVRFTNGLISHPEPFACTISPRSQKYEALIRGLELRES